MRNASQCLEQRTQTPEFVWPPLQLRAEQREMAHEYAAVSTTAARTAAQLRSVKVTGCHPSATEAIVAVHFGACGPINRTTIVRDKATGEAPSALGKDGMQLAPFVMQSRAFDSYSAVNSRIQWNAVGPVWHAE
jgi:hypothetical protein